MKAGCRAFDHGRSDPLLTVGWATSKWLWRALNEWKVIPLDPHPTGHGNPGLVTDPLPLAFLALNLLNC